MNQSFYHFSQTLRNSAKIGQDPEATLAELIFKDSDFPKYSQDFQEISDYIELNSRYSDYVASFDAMWEKYRY
ncbi:YozE family protein [Aerococcus kribbianus]|uniref:YozE family protein n=1 Tax=Aerococcus kribbianus TaxID=2999064 RepID=A0A9X3FLQ2_9LACT|nr:MULTISPECIES: YozE family protein [unclassified Aerococcus]MCZ0716790.1 YozE family protein [Aerococcus sp. YH-aer221]MCZ0725078.1 YozE family protein [Aerococcus sp. YH-aer222]